MTGGGWLEWSEQILTKVRCMILWPVSPLGLTIITQQLISNIMGLLTVVLIVVAGIRLVFKQCCSGSVVMIGYTDTNNMINNWLHLNKPCQHQSSLIKCVNQSLRSINSYCCVTGMCWAVVNKTVRIKYKNRSPSKSLTEHRHFNSRSSDWFSSSSVGLQFTFSSEY